MADSYFCAFDRTHQLTNLIIKEIYFNDETLRPHIGSIAWHIIKVKKASEQDIENCLFGKKERTIHYINKLISRATPCFSPVVSPIGIHLSVKGNSDSLQSVLNKHTPRNAANTDNEFPIYPEIKFDNLFSHPKYVWFRIHTRSISRLQKTFDEECIKFPWYSRITFQILKQKNDEGYIELYCKKSELGKPQTSLWIGQIIRWLDSHSDFVTIIFCSQEDYFENMNLLLSNYVKFRYFQALNAISFDPESTHEMRILFLYLSQAAVFLKTSNLAIMPSDTHGSLEAATMERAGAALKKMVQKKSSRVFTCTGSRSSWALGLPSDLGARSSKIEFVTGFKIKEELAKLTDCCSLFS